MPLLLRKIIIFLTSDKIGQESRSFPFIQNWGIVSSLGPSLEDRIGHIGKSLMEGQQDDQGAGTFLL